MNQGAMLTRYVTQIGLILACLIGNIQLGILFDAETWYLAGLGIGLVSAELSLVGLWGGMGPGLWLTRLPWTICLSVAIFFAATIGYQIAHPPLTMGNLFIMLQVLMVATLAAQLPYLLFNRVGAYSLIPPSESFHSARQLDIRSLLISTAVLAVTVTIAQRQFPAFQPQMLLQRDSVHLTLLILSPLFVLLGQMPVGPMLVLRLSEGAAPSLRLYLWSIVATLLLLGLAWLEYTLFMIDLGVNLVPKTVFLCCLASNVAHFFFTILFASILGNNGFQVWRAAEFSKTAKERL